MDALDPNKASGPDGVENRLLKECSEELAPLLHTLYRKSLDTTDIPGNWKIAEILPIHKKGSVALVKNNRPVGMTSNIAKGAGRIWCRKIMSFLITAE